MPLVKINFSKLAHDALLYPGSKATLLENHIRKVYETEHLGITPTGIIEVDEKYLTIVDKKVLNDYIASKVDVYRQRAEDEFAAEAVMEMFPEFFYDGVDEAIATDNVHTIALWIRENRGGRLDKETTHEAILACMKELQPVRRKPDPPSVVKPKPVSPTPAPVVAQPVIPPAPVEIPLPSVPQYVLDTVKENGGGDFQTYADIRKLHWRIYGNLMRGPHGPSFKTRVAEINRRRAQQGR